MVVWCVVVGAGAHVDVDSVHGDGFDADEELAGCGTGFGQDGRG